MRLKHSLDITILGATPGRPAFVAARLEDEVAFGRLPDDGTIDALLKYRGVIESSFFKNVSLTEKDMQTYGGQLGDLLFDGPVGDLYTAARSSGVRVNLLINDCELQQLPWEYLHGRNEDPGPRRIRSVSRVVSSGPGLSPPPPLPGVLNVLLLVARDPSDKIVPLADLTKAMEARFTARIGSVKAELAVRPVDSFVAISRALEERKWDVVHYLGHGDVVQVDGETAVAGLIIPTNGGNKLLDGLKLAAMLADRLPRLIVLSACSTGQSYSKSRFGNLAHILVRHNVPAVIANQMVITAESISEFCSALYDNLLSSGDIDEAVVAGRLQSYATLVAERPDNARVEWGIPILYRQHSAQKLFAEAAK